MKGFTQDEFDRLPALLTRAIVMQWTGLSGDELSAEAAAKSVRTYPEWGKRKRGHHKYFKQDVARICGMKS